MAMAQHATGWAPTCPGLLVGVDHSGDVVSSDVPEQDWQTFFHPTITVFFIEHLIALRPSEFAVE